MQLDRVEVWTDVACNGGERVGVFFLGALAQCTATWAIDGQEGLVLSVPRRHAYAGTLTRGRVVRVQDADPSDFSEWRVTDLDDASDALYLTVRCDSMALELARAVYMAIDGVGAPTAEYAVVGATLTDIVDGLVRDALDAAGLTYLVTGTIEPTGEIDLAGEWGSARSILLDAIGKAGGELRVRRNGTTDYRIDILDAIGAGASVPTIRTARNLLATKRKRSGSLGGTRIVPRGRDDATHRGIGYAYWQVTDVDTGANTLTIRDPRGAGFPSPLPFADMALGWWVEKWSPVPDPRLVLSSVDGPNDGTAVVTLDRADGFVVGDIVEFGVQTFESPQFVAATNTTTSTDTITLPAQQVGDFVIVVGYRAVNNTPVDMPTGLGSDGWTSVADASLTGTSYRIIWHRSTAAKTSVTMPNAQVLIAAVYRGADGIGAVVADTDTGTAIDFSPLTALRPDATSWGLAFVGHRTATNIETPPTGLTNRASAGNNPEIALHDLNAGFSTYAGGTHTANASGEWFTVMVEAFARPEPLSRLWGLTDPAVVSASAGIYDRILDRPQQSGAVNRWPDPYLTDYSGTIRVSGGSEKIDADTASAVVMRHTGGINFLVQVSVGDRILRASDDALVGTVLTVDAGDQLTLTANALVDVTAGEFAIEKDAPIGSAWIEAPNNHAMLTSQVTSAVPNLAGAKAWRITATPTNALVRLGTAPIPISPDTPYLIWAWVNCVSIPSGKTCRISLQNITSLPDANAIIGNAVDLTHATHNGQLVRVVFQSPGLIAAEGGIGIGIEVDDTCTLEVGPVGAVPSAWTPVDIAAPNACDLWHEGTLWLQSQTLPTGYDVDLSDLYTLDEASYPYDALTLGGSVRVDDRDLGVVTVQRIVSLATDYLQPGATRITLGNRTKGLAEYLAERTGQSIADVALTLSRGLVGQAQVITDTPQIQVSSAGTTVSDPEPLFLVAGAIQAAFTD